MQARSSQVAESRQRRVAGEIDLQRRHRDVALRDGVEIGAGPGILSGAGGATQYTGRPRGSSARIDGLGAVPVAEPAWRESRAAARTARPAR